MPQSIHGTGRIVIPLRGSTVILVALAVIVVSCNTSTRYSQTDLVNLQSNDQISQESEGALVKSKGKPPSERAKVTAVTVSGGPGAYTFTVTVSSPDAGCNQYTDWWELVSENESLLYRRSLLHSHIDEQPFSRSGGPVDAQADDVVIIRAHMNSSGYGDVALKGTVDDGFTPVTLPAVFAGDLEMLPPQPPFCEF